MLPLLGASNPLRNPRRRRRWLTEAKSPQNHISNWTPNNLRPILFLRLALQMPTTSHQPADDQQRLVAEEVTYSNIRANATIHRPLNASLRRRTQRRLAFLHPILRLKIRRKQIALRRLLRRIQNSNVWRPSILLRPQIRATNPSFPNQNHSQKNNQKPQKTQGKRGNGFDDGEPQTPFFARLRLAERHATQKDALTDHPPPAADAPHPNAPANPLDAEHKPLEKNNQCTAKARTRTAPQRRQTTKCFRPTLITTRARRTPRREQEKNIRTKTIFPPIKTESRRRPAEPPKDQTCARQTQEDWENDPATATATAQTPPPTVDWHRTNRLVGRELSQASAWLAARRALALSFSPLFQSRFFRRFKLLDRFVIGHRALRIFSLELCPFPQQHFPLFRVVAQLLLRIRSALTDCHFVCHLASES